MALRDEIYRKLKTCNSFQINRNGITLWPTNDPSARIDISNNGQIYTTGAFDFAVNYTSVTSGTVEIALAEILRERFGLTKAH